MLPDTLQCTPEFKSNCHKVNIIQPILIALAVTIPLLIVIFCVVYQMRFHLYSHPFWSKWCFKVIAKREDQNLQDLDFDAFILGHDNLTCGCKVQTDGQDSEILLQFRQQFNGICCETSKKPKRTYSVQDRSDFLLGRSENEQLQSRVQNSKRCIVLLTKDFVNSHYHAQEFQQIIALYRNRFILIFVGIDPKLKEDLGILYSDLLPNIKSKRYLSKYISFFSIV